MNPCQSELRHCVDLRSEFLALWSKKPFGMHESSSTSYVCINSYWATCVLFLPYRTKSLCHEALRTRNCPKLRMSSIISSQWKSMCWRPRPSWYLVSPNNLYRKALVKSWSIIAVYERSSRNPQTFPFSVFFHQLKYSLIYLSLFHLKSRALFRKVSSSLTASELFHGANLEEYQVFEDL